MISIVSYIKICKTMKIGKSLIYMGEVKSYPNNDYYNAVYYNVSLSVDTKLYIQCNKLHSMIQIKLHKQLYENR